jgi:small subunit ribosomal protein S23
MGGRNLRATRLLRVATRKAEAGFIVQMGGKQRLPSWADTLRNIPPAETLTRPLTPRTDDIRHRKPKKPGRDLYRPQQIVYEEDGLRTRFFKDHPWELARPRIMLEQDGTDARRVDWSKGVRQPGVVLSGEWYSPLSPAIDDHSARHL